MEPTRSVFVCGVPRSGTSLIASLLHSSGAVGWPGEWFWHDDVERFWREWEIADWPAYVDEVRRRATAPNGVFGCKVMWGYLADALFQLRRLSEQFDADDVPVLRAFFGEPQFVWITREDEVAQAVSWSRAAQTGQWMSEQAPTAEPVYDDGQIAGLLALVRVHTGAWRRWFEHQRVLPVTLTYEELCRDQQGTTLRVLADLGLEPAPGATLAPWSWLRPQADELNAAWIERFNG